MNALQHLLHDRDYLTAKARLEAQGYTAVSHTGMIPFIFKKKGKPTLYLFRPALDGRSPYRVEVTADTLLRPASFPDYAKPVLYIPANDYTESRKGTVRYYWHPRRLEDLPLLYLEQGLVTKQDISEMLAVSLINVHYATHSGRNRLAEHSSVGGCKLYHVDTVLAWNGKRRGSISATAGCATPKRRGYQAPCKAVLVEKMQRHLERGKVSDAALRESFKAICPDVANGVDGLVAAAQGMKRRVLLPVLAKHGVIRLPEAVASKAARSVKAG